MAAKRDGPGRPTDYKAEYAEQGRKLALLGATDKQMAEFWGVCEATVNNWKTAHPEFLESITQGKMLADASVAESLYQRALGYSHPDTKFFCYEGAVIAQETTRHYPPDTQAASLWLRNRQPELWRDRKELTGADGQPLTPPALEITFGDHESQAGAE